ncbi:MAG: tetratricopeptide repeat protein, partial [Acidobacteriota bacterium]
RHKTLLVLDGLEPLQYPPGAMEGQLKDPALDVLIRKLSLHNPGLCIITSREKLSDIAYLEETTAPVIQLEDLSPQAGALLLKRLGVKGTDEELQEASQAFAGHALALTLLGTYLSEFHHGDIRHWREVPLLKGVQKQSDHAVWVMESYKVRLGVGGGKLKRKFKRVLLELGLRQPTSGEIAWSYLLLMGFFDRPAKGEEIQALLAEPPIPGLSEKILKLEPPARKRALSRLRRLRLLAESPPEDPHGMDAHPLLREYLTDQLQQRFPEACREGHRRLYRHLKQRAKEFPETLEEMMPLYQAVAHGCRAGLDQETLNEIYLARILRGDEHFSWKKLGSFGADLAAVSNYFEHPWNQPNSSLRRGSQAFLLHQAGLYLRALGRLLESVEPMEAALEAQEVRKDWLEDAKSANNLSELHLTLGNLPQAVDGAKHSLELADRSGDAFWKMANRTTLADALHQCGDLAQARSLFQQAEQMQKGRQPQYPLLYSLWGFRYCDLLLGGCETLAWTSATPQPEPAPSRPQALSRCREVRERAEKMFEWRVPSDSLLLIALDHLTLGRAFLLEAALEAPSPDLLSPAQYHLDRAVTGLRQAGTTHHQPRALIARAQLHRVQFQHSGDEAFAQRSQQDLTEAAQIASRGPMPLFQADIHLEQSRLHHAQGNSKEALQALSQARTLIQKHAYHRRDAELEG